jgi:PEGA domain
VTGGGYGGYFPWGYGGLGFGGYYGYYDPWWYDPYPPVYGGGDYDYDGALRLKVKPRDASVYVDGYFAGRVDDFDGVFQRLKIEPGPHRVELRLDGYETLTFEVRIDPDRKITYTGELKKLP